MTTFPGAPRLTKGAIIGFDLLNPLASVVIFQYNPKKLSRTVEAQAAEEQEGTKASVMRLKGAPIETIAIQELELDAVDQLEQGSSVATGMGIYPQLSALEMLLYPKSATVILNTIQLALGTIEIVNQPAAPFTLFVWGIKRVVPVRLTSFTISELEYDPGLNPILATVSLSMRVLSYSDFSVTHPGYHIFLAHQIVKETMAVVGSVGNLADVVGGNVSLL